MTLLRRLATWPETIRLPRGVSSIACSRSSICLPKAASTVRARVRDGRLIVDEPTDVPEGTELDLVIDDAGDRLEEAERAALHAAIGQAWASFQAGEGRLAADVLADLAKR